MASRNRALAGEVGRFVDAVRKWDTPNVLWVRMPDGTEYRKEPDYSAYHRVHSGMMGSIEDFIQKRMTGAARVGTRGVE